MTAPVLTTRLAPVAGSFDPATRTFSAVAASGSPVKRADYFAGDSYLEVLSMDPKAIRLERFASGRAPLLNSHRNGSLEDQIGVIMGARIENGELVVSAQLSARDDVRPIADDIAAGITSNVSIGYRVHRSEEQRAKDGSRTITHVDWEPYELSLVTIPADPSAFIRSLEVPSMDNQHQTALDPNEAQRIAQISDIAKRNGIDAIEVETAIGNNTSVTDFRARALEILAARSDATSINSRHNDTTFGNPAFLARAIEDAIYCRMSGKAPEGPAQQWAARSLLDMGSAVLQARGQRPSWLNRDQLASQIMSRSGGQHTTSDFPVLLTQAGARVLQDAYASVQTPLKALARKRTAVDFRALTSVRLSEAPKLLEVGESGEIKHGSRSEAKETFALKTYSRLFGLSRNAVVNDSLDAFADTARAWGRAASETEADVLVGILLANSGNGITLDDGSPLYHSSRKNKAASGSAINITSISAARQALRQMVGLDGKTPVSANPRHLVVGPAQETAALQIVSPLMATTSDEVNVFAGAFAVHCEPRLTGNAWRLFTDPRELAVLEYAYLSGQEGPILDVRPGWETLGLEFRATLDFGASICVGGEKGTYLDPGQA